MMNVAQPISLPRRNFLIFVPMYLKRDIDNLFNISEYDLTVASTMNMIMSSALTLTPVSRIRDKLMVFNMGRGNDTSLDEIIDTYYNPGDYIFNDDTITINGKTAFEFITPKDNHPTSTPMGNDYTVLCGEGCTNIVVDRNRETIKSVYKWLLSILFSRLEDDVVLASGTFEDYWLKL